MLYSEKWCGKRKPAWRHRGENMELSDIRKKIDSIDGEIVSLYEKRMRLCEAVAEYKIENGRNVLDPEREQNKLLSLGELTEDERISKDVTELFRQIMAMSRRRQYSIMTERGIKGKPPFMAVDSLDTAGARIIFQGITGAYSEAAAIAFFGNKADISPVATFRDVMRAIGEGRGDYGVLPIENSSSGIVNANYDLLTEYENYIVAEQVLEIDNCLMGLPGAELKDIKKVYSHPQALMQCTRFLDKHPSWEQEGLGNTAMAAKKVRDDGDVFKAAIGGRRAAEVYGLKILETGISVGGNNFTRFIVVGNQRIFLRNAKKISICFEIEHRSGSLYEILSHFIFNDLNMTKIESRPIPDRPFEYRFFVDFEGNLVDSGVRNALSGIREESRNLRILGNY